MQDMVMRKGMHMEKDTATKEKLLQSAKKEFLERGYMKASLRTICRNAGVTTGALYFFFQNKEDLLRCLVDPLLHGLMAIIDSHFSSELSMETIVVSAAPDSDDIRTAKEIVRFLYRHYDEFLILLTKSQGSVYEDIVGQYADMAEEHYLRLVEIAVQTYGVKKPSRYMLHWMSHLQINAFVHLLIHEPDEKKALAEIEQIVIFLISGWNGMLCESSAGMN